MLFNVMQTEQPAAGCRSGGGTMPTVYDSVQCDRSHDHTQCPYGTRTLAHSAAKSRP